VPIVFADSIRNDPFYRLPTRKVSTVAVVNRNPNGESTTPTRSLATEVFLAGETESAANTVNRHRSITTSVEPHAESGYFYQEQFVSWLMERRRFLKVLLT
jgi:hypothetical protein